MIKLLLQYPTLQLSAIDKMVFCFENCFDLLREKIVLVIKIFLQSRGPELLQNTNLFEQ